MSEKKNNGGSAFPRSGYRQEDADVFIPGALGMTLRQWYAGMALNGIIRRVHFESGDGPILENVAAHLSFKYADAMIVFEEKEKE